MARSQKQHAVRRMAMINPCSRKNRQKRQKHTKKKENKKDVAMIAATAEIIKQNEKNAAILAAPNVNTETAVNASTIIARAYKNHIVKKLLRIRKANREAHPCFGRVKKRNNTLFVNGLCKINKVHYKE